MGGGPERGSLIRGMQDPPFEKYQDSFWKDSNKRDEIFLDSLLRQIEFNNQLKNQTEKAIILFNDNPEKGIKFMIKKKLIAKDPYTIAEFLIMTPGLSKFAIGQFLGKKDTMNKEILIAFCHKIDFNGLNIDEALRLFLQQFRLPGEG